jgi:hypothetical protein
MAAAIELSGELIQVLIHADSGQEVAELRRLRLDIVRVRPDTQQAQAAPSLERQPVLVEAVVDRAMVNKLRRLGFRVETPRTAP